MTRSGVGWECIGVVAAWYRAYIAVDSRVEGLGDT